MLGKQLAPLGVVAHGQAASHRTRSYGDADMQRHEGRGGPLHLWLKGGLMVRVASYVENKLVRAELATVHLF